METEKVKLSNCESCPFKYRDFFKDQEIKPAIVDLVIVNDSPLNLGNHTDSGYVDDSSRLLKKMLLLKGISNITFRVISTLKCVVPPKESSTFTAKKLKQAISSCTDPLRDELMHVKGKLYLIFGTTALHMFTGDSSLKITQEVGKVFQSPYGMAMACVSPRSVVRSSKDLMMFEKTLEKAALVLREGLPAEEAKTKFRVIPTEEIPKIIQDLSKYSYLSVDIETTGFNPRTREMITLGISWAKDKAFIFEGKDVPKLKPLLENPNIKFVWHNGKFDLRFVRHMGVNARVDDDTMLMHYAMNEIKATHDLEKVAMAFLGVSAWEHDVVKYLDKNWGYKFAPRVVLDGYLAKDCNYTLQLFHVFNEFLHKPENEGLLSLYNRILIPASEFLTKVESRGLFVHNNTLRKAYKSYRRRQQEALRTIHESTMMLWDAEAYKLETGAKTAPAVLNPSSWQQIGWLLYKRLKIQVPRDFDQDTAEETLEAIEHKHPMITPLLELRKVEKLLGTYIVGVHRRKDVDNRIRASFLIHGTVTGRLASRDPNLQNVPRKGYARDLYAAPPGRKFVEADYKGAELRVLALRSGDRFLTQVFIDGRDLHDEVSLQMYGPGYTEEQRVRAKAINFGIPYGREAYSIALEFGITLREAQNLIDKWMAAAPEAAAYIRAERAKVERGEVIFSPFGRRRRFGIVNMRTLKAQQNEAVNFAIQCTASDFTLLSGIEMDDFLVEAYDSKILNLVHDSILVECPDDPKVVANVKRHMSRVMCTMPKITLGTDIPFEVEFKDGYHWGSLEKDKIKY